jgi:hypothetical protein
VGLFTAGWLLLTNVSLIFSFGRHSLIIMWGIFAAIAFGYSPGLVVRVYPWDLPALFFFTLWIILFHHGKYYLLPIVIIIGMLFKETTIVLLVGFLFLPLPLRKRLNLVLITGIFYIIVKVIVELAVQNPIPFLSLSVTPDNKGGLQDLWIIENLALLLQSRVYAHPIWVNAGTLLALLLLPSKGRSILMLKSIAALFVISIFIFGKIFEYRIWFEAAPIAVYGLALYFSWTTLPKLPSVTTSDS